MAVRPSAQRREHLHSRRHPALVTETRLRLTTCESERGMSQRVCSTTATAVAQRWAIATSLLVAGCTLHGPGQLGAEMAKIDGQPFLEIGHLCAMELATRDPGAALKDGTCPRDSETHEIFATASAALANYGERLATLATLEDPQFDDLAEDTLGALPDPPDDVVLQSITRHVNGLIKLLSAAYRRSQIKKVAKEVNADVVCSATLLVREANYGINTYERVDGTLLPPLQQLDKHFAELPEETNRGLGLSLWNMIYISRGQVERLREVRSRLWGVAMAHTRLAGWAAENGGSDPLATIKEAYACGADERRTTEACKAILEETCEIVATCVSEEDKGLKKKRPTRAPVLKDCVAD